MQTSLIGADQQWLLLAVMLAAAAFGKWAERTPWGAKISGAVVTLGATCVLSNVGILPHAAPVYDVVWEYLVPLAIPLLLFGADLRRAIRDAGRTLVAFACGGIGTAVGVALAFGLTDLGANGWKVASTLCATYIGGSINLVSVAGVLGVRPGDELAAIASADQLVATAYFVILFSLPSIAVVRRFFPPQDPVRPWERPTVPARSHSSLLGSLLALSVAAVVCAIGHGASRLVGLDDGHLLFVTGLTVVLATAAPQQLRRLGGSEQMGYALMLLLFASIGSSADLGAMLRSGLGIFAFAGIVVIVHLLFLLGTGWVLQLPLPDLLLASNACVGGPSTAAAMAVACRWRALVVPAVLCGTLGYVTATFIGVGIGTWLRAVG